MNQNTEEQHIKLQSQQSEDDEIDLMALAKTTWTGRKIILRAVIVCAILGVVIALLSPKEYTASTTLVPQLSSGSSRSGGLSSLAAMAGFNLNLNQSTSELSPMIYPQIVQSVPFQLELMKTPFTFPGVEKPVSLFEYYTEYSKPGALSLIKKYTIGLPFVILKAIRGEPEEDSITINEPSETIQLTSQQEGVRKVIAGKVSLEPNDREGYIVLTTNFSDPYLAAQVARKAQQLLQKSITEFKIEKAQAELDFIKGRLEEKKQEFENAQAALAAFRDRNKNVTSAMARTEEERLQNEYQLAFDVYSSLAQQYEQAQIKVKEDTPVFSVIKPVTVPLERSKPNRKMIVIIWVFLGGLAGVGLVFAKHYWPTLKKRWKEAEDKESQEKNEKGETVK
jgi:uncharacterized protein involved in exopolysaccharide biosynthesis